MKKIFILTGEPSGDKLASKAIKKLKDLNSNIDYLCVGGEHLKALNIKSIYDLNQITYLGFTKVLLNIFKIKKKIDQTVYEIIKFNPDILFSVDSPDFTLRVIKKVKLIKPNIKTIHYVAPQVWVWRKKRAKKIKNFIDHLLLLFSFEKKYFDKENVKSTFVGHPLLDEKLMINSNNSDLINSKKKIISIFSGSRFSEVKILMPILIKFINLVQNNDNHYTFVFHTTKELETYVNTFLNDKNLKDCEVISDESLKQEILQKSFFAIAKSGTISLEICNAKVPSIIIYKMNFINFIFVKLLIEVKYANIFNIISKSEIIPELLQSDCNPNKIYEVFNKFIKNPELARSQLQNCNKILDNMKVSKTSSVTVANILNSEF